jgi:hypothetical protein
MLRKFFERGRDMENTNKNAMITCNELCNQSCNEGINTLSTCNDSARLSKDEWWFLVNTLESWGVFKPRAIVKKNPAAAWKVMCLCKDANVINPGSYFTTCFRNELTKIEAANFINSLEQRILKRA